jgi:spore maturation protein CgeB
MRIVLFYHSLISDWNHGNAHFLRGIATELLERGHELAVYEPQDAWSVSNLIHDHGLAAIEEFRVHYPRLSSIRYDEARLDLDRALDKADLVLVHEWNSPSLVARIGQHRARSGDYRLLFHDTHHRMVTRPEEMNRYELNNYDGILAFGQVISELYRSRGIADRVWTWHEAADTRVFRPLTSLRKEGDLVWIGNWGDEERTEELQEFLFEPVRELKLTTRMHGVRYPADAQERLKEAGIEYRGWIPNFKAPEIFSRFRVTLHVPRRPYVGSLPGIPTIRVFEALACGIPLISAPWEDIENLFSPGEDFLIARDSREMKAALQRVLRDPELASTLSEKGRASILARHTCGHRVDELMSICSQLEIRECIHG